MIRNRLVAWFRDGTAEVWQAITAARSEPSATCSPEWYAGLVVSPTSFSRQLGDMQLSLMRANEIHQQTGGRAKTGDEIAVSQ
jgi:hypothetical protein